MLGEQATCRVDDALAGRCGLTCSPAVDFYKRLMGFTEDVGRFGNDVLAFLRAPGSTNHHDLALLKIGAKATDASGRRLEACSIERVIGADGPGRY